MKLPTRNYIAWASPTTPVFTWYPCALLECKYSGMGTPCKQYKCVPEVLASEGMLKIIRFKEILDETT